MTIELNVEKIEFEAGYSVHELPVYRIALGELIPTNTRKTITDWSNPNSQTGSVGFMDVVCQSRAIPFESGIGYETKDVLAILVVGIEPEFRGRSRYLGYFFERAESLAREWGLDTIIADWIGNIKLRKVIGRFGYELYYEGEFGVKRL
ncbi:hypothetical protein HY500_01445 [Candidatus Woesearchaeota archaeon]|nr:hypothetical protein [Candidatus Woesearchaeota archaeon]